MAEYIERESLMKNFCGYDLTKCVKYGNKNAEQQNDSYSTMMMYEIAYEIKDAPTADVAPVRHGEWLWLDGYGEKVACSECLEIFDTDAYDANAGNEWNFCPKCGAKMDGGETT